jgi:IS4 transposase
VSEEAKAAGVRRDLRVRLGSHGRSEALRGPVRLVEVECTEYSAKTLRSKRHGLKPGDTMWIVTDRLDLAAETVALVYRCRWQIELFFRFLKHTLGCEHLLSHCENGIQLQLYSAIIACLLIALYTGAKPNKASRELLYWYWLGLADEEDLLAHAASLKKQA